MYLPGGPIKYLMHCISSVTRKVDGEFMDEFTNHILRNKTILPEHQAIESHRHALCRNHTLIASASFGAGSRSRGEATTIGYMAQTASVNPKYGRLLFWLVRHYQPAQVIELGTALGISSLYMAMANKNTRIITIEGNPQLAEMAMLGFNAHGLTNITLIHKTFEDALPVVLPTLTGSTLIFIDGNHTREATVRYYQLLGENSGKNQIMVLDDINWSYPMSQAWDAIVRSKQKGLVIDLFRLGIIFEDRENNGQKYRFIY